MNNLLSIDSVSKHYGDFIALNRVSINIKEGSIIEGKVKNITDYGAFVDLGGIDGLVHVTDLGVDDLTCRNG